MATEIDSLRNKHAIVRHSFNDLILIYTNPRNFRKNNIGKWVFNCDSFYAFMPMWVKHKRVELRTPKDEREELADTIDNIDNFDSINEWLKMPEQIREVFERIF